MTRKKTVAIWAPLRYANYGDDLQAIAFGLMIKDMGYHVRLFQLEESLSRQYALESAGTIEELCEGTNICIIAGGALLTPFNIIKRHIHKAAIEYEQDFRDLLRATRLYPTKFCAISMGGDGQLRTPWKYYSRSRIEFFKSPSFLNGTVRLEGDVRQMAKFGKDFSFYPDMLFQTPKIFKYDPLPPTKKFRVGINFKKGRYLDKKLMEDIMDYARSHDDIEFHFTTTHMEKIGLNYQYLPSEVCPNVIIDKYESPRQLLGVLASVDIFITSMLHLGLTGLTVGTPFVSYRGPGKTKSFLHSIGGDWAVLDDNITFEELKSTLFSHNKKQLYSQYDVEKIEKMVHDSEKQYEYCRKIVEQYA